MACAKGMFKRANSAQLYVENVQWLLMWEDHPDGDAPIIGDNKNKTHLFLDVTRIFDPKS